MENSDRLLRVQEVIGLAGISRSTIYSMIADGSFPAQRRISRRAVGWLESEIEAWKASRPPARPGPNRQDGAQ